ncbi:MAG: ATP-dependent helicase/deoxyribonuclease subunit B [Clostridiales bacterium 38_11]|nr:MAG: ATP-dependent helicase/deoxyribonuclease subunit B [Clostridiales bacterium 38_11]
MSFELITGGHHSGKTRYVYDKIKMHSKDVEQECILIVPDRITFNKEKELISCLDKVGILNIQVLSFNRLAHIVLEETGGLKTESINDYGKMMLLRKIIYENRDEFMLFKDHYSQQGVLKEMNSLINEFKNCNISVQFLSSVRNTLKEGDSFKSKLMDIELIYRNLNEFMENTYLDDLDLIKLCASKINESSLVKNAVVFIDEFLDFNASELELIKQVAIVSKDMYVALNDNNDDYFDPEGEYSIIKDSIQRIKTVASDIGHTIRSVELADAPKSGTDMDYLSCNFFANTQESYTDIPNHINLFYALNPHNEIVEIAERIVGEVRDNAYRWRELAIIIGDEEVYKKTIEKVFEIYEIPYFFDMKRDILFHPMVTSILSMMDISLYNQQAKDVFRFLKCGYVDLTRDEIEELENYVIKHGVYGYKWKRQFKYDDPKTERMEGIRQKIEKTFRMLDGLKKKSSVIHKVKILTTILEDMDIYQKSKEITQDLKANAEFEKAYENAQVWNAIMSIFEQIVSISEDTVIDMEELKNLLKTGFEEYQLSIIPPSEDSVTISTVSKATFVSVKNVYMVGMNEGMIPSIMADKGILYNDERSILSSLGAQIHLDEYNIEVGRHSFKKLLNAYSEKISFSYSLSDVEGKSLRPSIHVSRLKQLFPKLRIDGGVMEKSRIAEVVKPSINYLSDMIRLRMTGVDLSDTVKQFYLWLKDNKPKLFSLIEEGMLYDNKAAIEDKSLIGLLYEHPLKLSSYAIESYNSCRFKYFTERGLCPVPRQEYKIDYRDIGDIYHKTMEAVTENIINDEGFLLEDESTIKLRITKFAQESVDEVEAQNDILNDSFRNQYIKGKIQKTAEISASYLVKQLQKSKFRPVIKEAGFGFENATLKPMRIEFGEDEWAVINGRIDRIDMYSSCDKRYVTVLDYKSSSKTIDLNEVLNGIGLQLFLYLDVALVYNKDVFGENLSFGGLFYFKISDPLIDGDKIEDVEIDEEIFRRFSLQGYVIDDVDIIKNMDIDLIAGESSKILGSIKLKQDEELSSNSKTLGVSHISSIMTTLEDIVKETAQGICFGSIDVNPYQYKDRKPCTFCDYLAICQFDQALPGNQYRRIKQKSEKEIIDSLEKGDDHINEMD